MIFRKIVFLISFLATSTSSAQQTFDVLVQGGRIIDGSGNPWYKADIGIRGERIVSIGDLSNSTASQMIDASGLVVSPGFIDPHTHALRGIFDVPNAESSLLQGITRSPKVTTAPRLIQSMSTTELSKRNR